MRVACIVIIFTDAFVLQSALSLLSKTDRKLLDDSLNLRSDRVQFFLVHNEVHF